jgi:hypothetical protein
MAATHNVWTSVYTDAHGFSNDGTTSRLRLAHAALSRRAPPRGYATAGAGAAGGGALGATSPIRTTSMPTSRCSGSRSCVVSACRVTTLARAVVGLAAVVMPRRSVGGGGAQLRGSRRRNRHGSISSSVACGSTTSSALRSTVGIEPRAQGHLQDRSVGDQPVDIALERKRQLARPGQFGRDQPLLRTSPARTEPRGQAEHDAAHEQDAKLLARAERRTTAEMNAMIPSHPSRLERRATPSRSAAPAARARRRSLLSCGEYVRTQLDLVVAAARPIGERFDGWGAAALGNSILTHGDIVLVVRARIPGATRGCNGRARLSHPGRSAGAWPPAPGRARPYGGEGGASSSSSSSSGRAAPPIASCSMPTSWCSGSSSSVWKRRSTVTCAWRSGSPS